jgi:hypothetical protein
MSNAASTSPGPSSSWIKTSGGYGRPAKMLMDTSFRQVAVLVTLPKAYAEQYNGLRYMVTDRRPVAFAERLPTREFVKRADAVRYAEDTYLA